MRLKSIQSIKMNKTNKKIIGEEQNNKTKNYGVYFHAKMECAQERTRSKNVKIHKKQTDYIVRITEVLRSLFLTSNMLLKYIIMQCWESQIFFLLRKAQIRNEN